MQKSSFAYFFFFGVFSFVIIMMWKHITTLIADSSVTDLRKVYMTNIVHSEIKTSNHFEQNKKLSDFEEAKTSQNYSLPQEYKDRISRIEEVCQKYLDQSVNPEEESINIPSHIQFITNKKVNYKILLC